MRSLKALVCLLLFVAAGQARENEYAYYKTSSLSGAAEAITLQQPSSSAKLVVGKSATLYCSAACTWTLAVNGTAATATAATELVLSEGSPTPSGTVFSSSNVGAGTTIATYVLAAGEKVTIDLSSIRLRSASTAKNLTLSTNSITATVTITLKWQEF